MSLKSYLAARKSFTKKGINFSIIGFNGSWRAICSSERKSNASGTNGVRFSTGQIKPGFYATLTPEDLDDITAILAAESKAQGIQFTVDDSLTQEEGLGCIIFYRMSVLRSAVII